MLHGKTGVLGDRQVAIGHTRNTEGQRQGLEQHLDDVARLTRQFARPLGAPEVGYLLGLWHDIGKWHPRFQQRLAAGSSWREQDFVFTTSTGGPIPANRVRRGYCAALEEAGLPRQPFHYLRHAFATLQVEDGEDIANVSKLLGHASVATTADLYAHLTPKTQKRAAERMERILAG